MEKRKLLTLVLLLTSLGCATGKVRPGTSDSAPSTGTEDPTLVGPPLPENYGPEALPRFGPDIPTIHAWNIYLLPGGAKGFAHAGILFKLKEKKIPIRAIAGVEMGALVAAVFVTSKTTNEFEWKMSKLEPDLFTDSRFSLKAIVGKAKRGERLKEKVKLLLGEATFQSAPFPLYIGALEEKSKKLKWINSGSLADAVLSSMDGIFVGEPEESLIKSGVIGIIPPSTNGTSVTMVVDPWGEDPTGLYGEGRLNSSELLKQATLLVTPDLRDVGLKDFTKKPRAIFLGRQAIEDRLARILEFSGLVAKEMTSP